MRGWRIIVLSDRSQGYHWSSITHASNTCEIFVKYHLEIYSNTVYAKINFSINFEILENLSFAITSLIYFISILVAPFIDNRRLILLIER